MIIYSELRAAANRPVIVMETYEGGMLTWSHANNI